jgi:hypothetical protein
VRGPLQVDLALRFTDVPRQVLIVDLDAADAPARALLYLAQERAAA